MQKYPQPTGTILLCCLMAMLAYIPGISFSNPLSDPLFDASPEVFELQPESFLPVEEAYQLDASLENQTLHLNWTVSDGYYLYKHKFNFFQDNKPLSITDLTYERTGSSLYDDYYERELEVYYQQISMSLPLSPAVLQSGQLIVESQACADAGLCYPPRKQVINYSVLTDAKQAQISEWRFDQKSAPYTQTEPPVRSFALIALFALLGGLILNLMPCVFPVLSIKVLSLATHQEGTGKRILHGMTYTAGVILCFALIALVMLSLRSAGKTIGWGFQLQSPLVVTLLIYLFVLMGLSFSGFFYMGSRFVNLGQGSIGNNSLSSSFLTGVLASVVASPCSAPFMGTAIGFTLTQSTMVSLLVFMLLGLGMALPFLLLSAMPHLAARLPRPGAWMDTLKQLLAFPLYFSAVWLIWVLGRQANSDLVAAVCTGLVLLVFAIWVTHREGDQKLFAKLIAAIAVLAALIIPWQNYQTSLEPASHPWEPYSSERLTALLRSGEPVFVNLTADWCITCLTNEKTTLDTETVRDAFTRAGVVYLKGDWTRYDPDITRLLNQHRRSGVPLYLFYPSGSQTPTVLPQILSKKTVLEVIGNK